MIVLLLAIYQGIDTDSKYSRVTNQITAFALVHTSMIY